MVKERQNGAWFTVLLVQKKVIMQLRVEYHIIEAIHTFTTFLLCKL